MSKPKKGPRSDASKLKNLPSLHLIHPVVGMDGMQTRVLYGDQWQWHLKCTHVPTGLAAPDDSLIAAGGGNIKDALERAAARDRMAAMAEAMATIPTVVWEISSMDPQTGEGVMFIVPIAGAHVRQPMELVTVRNETPEGTKRVQTFMPKHVAAKARESAAEAAKSPLVTAGPEVVSG